MFQREIEHIAIEAFQRSGVAAPGDHAGLVRGIVGVGKRSALKIVDAASLGSAADLSMICGRWTVCIASNLTRQQRAWHTCRCVAEFLAMSLPEQVSTEFFDRLAAALLIPAHLVASVQHHEHVARLADACDATHTCGWLRFGEISRPTAVLTPSRIYSRGLDVDALIARPNIASGRILDAPNRVWFCA